MNLELILILVIVSLTVLLLIVGFQAVLIIIDVRRALKRLNNILDDAILGGGLIRPEKLTSVLELIKKKKNKNMTVHGTSGDEPLKY